MSRKLSPQARKIVKAKVKYLEVHASPGSGKTTTAVARVKALLEDEHDASIHLLSFSNTTVNTLRERLRQAGVDADSVSVSTCHSLARALGAKLLKRASRAGGEPDYKAMLKAGTKALKTKSICTVTHLIVDEYQDCSAAQHRFIVALAKRATTTVVLGDRMQAIYAFAGHGYRPLAELLPGVESLPLTESFRLTRENAALANAIAGARGGEEIVATRSGERPVLKEFAEAAAQIAWVTRRIAKLIAKGAEPSSIAVLGRNRSTVDPIARALQSHGIKTRLLGRTSGHEQHVLELFRMLAVVAEHRDRLAALRVGNGVRRGVRKRNAKIDRRLNRLLGDCITAALPEDEQGEDDQDDDGEAADAGALDTARDTAELVNSDRWSTFIKEVRKLVLSPSRDAEGTLRQLTGAFVRLNGGEREAPTLAKDLYAWTSQARQQPTAKCMLAHVGRTLTADAVTCTNIHRAKGMEWDHVFVVDVTDGILPDYRSTEGAALEAERALLYVAVTRARRRLWVCSAPAYGRHARKIFKKTSRLMTAHAVRRTFRA